MMKDIEISAEDWRDLAKAMMKVNTDAATGRSFLLFTSQNDRAMLRVFANETP